MNGNNILVLNSSDGMAVAGTRSDTLQVGCDMIEISSASDNEWKHRIAGRKDWSLTTAFLVTDGVDVRRVLQVGMRVYLKIKGRGDTDANGVKGYALVSSCDINAQRGNLANGTFKFTGDGPLT